MIQNTIPRVLWVDDKPQFLEKVRRLLHAARMSLQIDEVTSSDDAEQLLRKRPYSAVVADYRLNEFDPATQSGAAFLAKISRHVRALPKFVYSAFLEDPIYTQRVREADVVMFVDKTQDLRSDGLASDPFFSELVSRATLFESLRDITPEAIPYDDYRARPESYKTALAVHWRKNRSWIEGDLRRAGFVWGVACGEQLIDGSPDIFDFPDTQRLEQLGRKNGLIPFAYSVDLPVEANWGYTRYVNDRFPRLAVKVASLVLDDFDTGAMQTHLSDELLPLTGNEAMVDHVHLGRPYRSATTRVDINLIAHNGAERTASIPVRVVENWASSPFVTVNPSRKMLIGRDILRAFRVEIRLNSLTNRSEVHFI